MKNEREQEILNLLVNQGYMSVTELSERLFTSESSIRRHLTSLQNQGLVKRNYGGVELLTKNSQILPFATRAYRDIPQKQEIARKACKLIKDDDVVFLDQSSTTFFLAYELMKRSHITIITNNIEILSLLSATELEVISTGGRLSRENRSCMVGDDATQCFSQIRADYAFFSTKALASDGTLFDCNREEVFVRNTMIANAAKKVYLCDTGKFDTYSSYKQGNLGDVDYLVTEKKPQEISLEGFPKLIIL